MELSDRDYKITTIAMFKDKRKPWKLCRELEAIKTCHSNLEVKKSKTGKNIQSITVMFTNILGTAKKNSELKIR